MGIVAKQSILNTIYTYIGFLFGAINTIFLFPAIFSKTQFGLFSYLSTTSNLLWPILAFGMHNTLIKFYHSYKTDKSKSHFFSWILITPILLFLIIGGLFLLFHNTIQNYYLQSNPIIATYSWLILFLGFFSAYFELFFAWIKIHLQSVKGNFIKEIFLRVMVSILLILVHFCVITFPTFIYTLLITYAFRTILMFVIAHKTSPLKLSFGKLKNVKSILSYSGLILITSIISIYLLDLDKLMIEYYLPLEKIPTYTIPVFIASVIAVPSRALLQITTPLTAKFLNHKDYISLNNLNKKSGLNGLIISGIIAILILTNTHSLFALVPNQYDLYIEIVIYIAIVKVFDASLGITNSILINSNAYHWVLLLGICILFLAITLNILFIPKYGIKGAALASFIAYSTFNIIKLLFVFYNFKIQPYRKKTVAVIVILSTIGSVFYWLKLATLPPILAIGIKGLLISFVSGISIYRLKI